MSTLRADDVRIPKKAREAVARHERVVVVNRERPVLLLVNPDDYPSPPPEAHRGRRLKEALALLEAAPAPDERFGDDLEAVLGSIGRHPRGPWARS